MSRSVGLTSDSMSASFTRLTGPGRSQQVAQRLREAIILGLIGNGERLPRETELARQFGVAVSTVREALDTLRNQDLVRTTRGSQGGSFVTSSDARQKDLVSGRLATLSRAQLHDIALHASAISGSAAATAAARATAAEVQNLDEISRSIDFADELSARRGEGLFRLEVAAAAQSPRLVAEELKLQAEFGPTLWFSMSQQSTRDEVRLAQRALIAALTDRDSNRARDSVAAQMTLLVSQVIDAGGKFPLDPLEAVSAAGDTGSSSASEAAAALASCNDLVQQTFDSLFERVRRSGVTLAGHLAALAQPVPRTSIETTVKKLAEQELLFGSRIVVGAGFAAAAGLVEDTPWHLSWWVHQDGDVLARRSPPRQLTIVESPESDFFRDYTRLEWWQGALDSVAGHVTGPYVDYLCTDDYIFTLTVPVFQNAHPIGVVGVDVTLSALEQLFLPAFRTVGHRLTLVNRERRVVVSTDAAIAPGSLLPAGGSGRWCGELPLELILH